MSNNKKGYITKKKNMNFQSVESLQSAVNVVNEAAAAVNDKKRTIKNIISLGKSSKCRIVRKN